MSRAHGTQRTAREHALLLGGQALLVSSPQGRFHHEALLGDAPRATLLDVEAYGEHIFYAFARGQVVHVWLGATGRFCQHACPPPAPEATTRVRFVGDTATLDVLAPGLCDLIGEQDKRAIIARLGPDPRRVDASPDGFFAYAARSRVAVASALQNQKLIAGVSEVDGARVLHSLGIAGSTPLRAIPHESLAELWSRLADD